eukprot:4148643-Prymnesium_polylepis.1
MPLASRSNQLSIVLDPAWLCQWARRAVQPVCSPAACDGAGERRAAMTAYKCFRCGVPGGCFILPDTFCTS